MNNFMWNKRPSPEAVKQWDRIKTEEDIIIWHKTYTPQFNDQQIEEILVYYKERNLFQYLCQQKDRKISDFEKLILDEY